MWNVLQLYVTLLLSEDFSGDSVLEGVRIVNPLVHQNLPGLLGLKPLDRPRRRAPLPDHG